MTLTTLCTCGHPALRHNQTEPEHPCEFVWGTTTLTVTDGVSTFNGDEHCGCEAYIELCPRCQHAKTAHETQPIPGIEGVDAEGNPGYFQVNPQELILAQRRSTLAEQAATTAAAALVQAEADLAELPTGPSLSGIFARIKAEQKVRTAETKVETTAAEQVSATENLTSKETGIFIKSSEIPRWGDCWRVKADGTVCGCTNYPAPSATDSLALWAWRTSDTADAGLFGFHHLKTQTMWMPPDEGS